MLATERNEAILDILKKMKTASSRYLCEQLYCSDATIRRSLITLEKAGLIKRFHGGATLIPDNNLEYPHFFREVENQKEKTYICDLALDFIANGYALFLDSSSTVGNISPSLSQYKDLTVVTNGLQTALNLFKHDSVQTYMAGGLLKEGSTSVIGELAGSFIGNFKVDLALISCRGIDESGLYEADPMQALVKQQMIANSEHAVLLCDSSKIGRSHFYKLTDFQNIEAVITDKKPDDKIIKAIEAAGCEVIY